MSKPDLPKFNGHTLKPGSRGKRVRDLQQALRDHYHQKLKVDGEYGPKTAGAIRRFQLHRPPLEVDGVVGQKTWHAIRTHVQKVDGWRKVRRNESKGAKRAVTEALKRFKNLHEQPGHDNYADWMPALFSKFGWHSGYAWCQYGANTILVLGGGPVIPSGYTPAVLQYARNRQYGLKVVGLDDRQRGDFLYYKWPGVSNDTCDHVGVDEGRRPILRFLMSPYDFEANTSPGTSGSQNNGGGWYERLYASRRPFLVARVRPTYGKVH
jgi:peptidoglycan hydrolase-like protein with peptidoglycan-binding domain